uniref:CRAL-TRIO domain-containing protein n=1 Tax=Timema genevievae TaxID=629358 RepID=A0A7R9PND3_TIMGE|nr:unnamed protein product [Timema genevievae]
METTLEIVNHYLGEEDDDDDGDNLPAIEICEATDDDEHKEPIIRRLLTPNSEDHSLPEEYDENGDIIKITNPDSLPKLLPDVSETKREHLLNPTNGGEVAGDLVKVVLDELSPNFAGTQNKPETSSSTSGKKSVEHVDCSFVFDRRDSKRLARKELGERVMEGLFIESRQTEGSFTPGLKKISAPDHLQSIDSPVAEYGDNLDDSFKRATDTSEEVKKLSVEENNNEHNTVVAASSEESAHPDLKSRGPVLILDPARLDLSLARWTPQLKADGSVDVPQERPSPVTSSQRCGRRKIQVSDDIYTAQEEDNLSSVSGAESPLSDMDLVDDPDLDDLLSHELDSPDDMEDSILERLGDAPPPIPELSAAEEIAEARSWRNCVVSGAGASHRHEGHRAVQEGAVPRRIPFGWLAQRYHSVQRLLPTRQEQGRLRLCHGQSLPIAAVPVPRYVLTTLDELITDDYVLVYLHGATSRGCMPTFSWLKRCYQMIDRRLRKNLKGLYLVHPTFWLKTIVVMTRPFISSKFSRKLSFVETLGELGEILPLEQASIPDRVKQLDAEIEGQRKTNTRAEPGRS